MKKIILLFTILLCVTNIEAQGFFSIARHVDSVYANDTDEDGPKANIERIKKRWEGQFNASGSFSTAATNFYNYSKNAYGPYKIQSGTCNSYEPTWKEIGPTMDGNNTGNLIGAGLIHRMTFHPNYGNTLYTDAQGFRTIFAMSGFGGIWKTDNDGDNWVRIKTDPYIPFSSVGELVIDPTNPLRMYVTTGTPGGGQDLVPYITTQRDYPNFTIGVYATDDGGNTWTQITTTTNGIGSGLFNGGSTYNLKLDPQNHNNLIFTSTDGVYYTTNAAGALSSINWTKEAQFSTTLGNFGLSNGDDQIIGLTYNPTTHEWFVSGLQIYSSLNPFVGGNWSISSGPLSGLDLSTGSMPGETDIIKRINIVNSPLPAQLDEVYALIYADNDKIGIAKKIGNNNWTIVPQYFSGCAGRSLDKQTILAVPGGGTAPNNTDYYIGNNCYYYYESATDNLSGTYPLSGGLHADLQSFYIHPLQPNKLWITSDGGISLKVLNDINYPNFYDGASYKNNGIQAQLLWQFDDSEQDKDYYLAALQDNGGQFIDDTYSNNMWKTSYFQGDGFKSQILDKNANDGLVDGSSFGPQAYNYSTGSISPFPGGGGTYYFSDPEHPTEKILLGGTEGSTKLKTTYNNGLNWYQTDVPNIPSVTLNYNNTVYNYFSNLDRKQINKVAYPNYTGTPLTVYAITPRTSYQEIWVANPMPSFLLKSTNGFNSQWNTGGTLDNNFSNVSQITNALYSAAKASNAITTTDIPQLSGITCRPEDSDRLWVCSSGLLPNFKVWESKDGGVTFINADPNGVFVNIPVFDVLAIEGPNEIVFAATLDGVYYSDKTMAGNWCKYGETPSVQVLGLKVNYCKNALIVTTYGRGAFEVSLPFQDVPSTDITGTQTWTTPHHFPNTSLTIKSNSTLTINNTSCFFGPNSRLIVEKGAKLVVNNSTLNSESSCNGYLWPGIEVQGDINTRQVITSGRDVNHGYVILQNNATVKNAHYALQNMVANGQNIDWSKLGGGIVRCTNAKFINCQKAVQFMPYTNHNALGNIVNDLSYFTSCQFLTDAVTASHNFLPETHAAFWYTKGINLTANTFKNLTPNAYPVESRGSGVISYDASYDVVRSCNPVNATTGACAGPQNVFENLYYAIDASASLPTASVRIIDNVFTNNHRGAVLHAVEYAQVMNNTMSIGDSYNDASSAAVAPCGIYLDGCDAYVVQNNTLNNASGSSNTLDFGIIASYSNNNPNELRQNTFSDIAVGIQAQENNNGLQLKCNKFINGTLNTADVKILGQATQGSIAQQQGACPFSPANSTSLPGNEFSHTCSAAQDLTASNAAYQVTYNTRTFVGAETPQSSCYNTSFYNVNSCINPGTGPACPATTGGSGGGLNPVQLRLAIKNSKQDINNLEQLLASGNKPNLYTAINNGNDNNVNTKLLQKSPYLSDSVLLAFLNHLPLFTEATLVNVLVANSPLSAQVLKIAFSLNLSLSALNTIKNAQVGTSQRTYTEANLAYEKNQLIINYNNQLSYVLNDKDNEARFDSLVLKYDFAINPKSRGLLAGALIDQQKYNQAQVQLDSLQSTDPQLSNFLAQLMQLRQIVNQIQGYSGNIKQSMDSLRLNRPAALAVKAQALYNSIFKKPFGEQIYLTQAQHNNAARIAQIAKVEAQIENSIIVFPNPTNNQITFMFGKEKQKNCTIEIYNANGQLVKNMGVAFDNESVSVEMQDLKDGIYFYRIYDNERQLKAGKIVLIK